MPKYPIALLNLINFLRKLPGVGIKTAERFAFQLLGWEEDQLLDFAAALQTLRSTIRHCSRCYCLVEGEEDSEKKELCTFCDDPKRSAKVLCIISSPKDAYVLEETRAYKGLYHVIKGLLSPLDGKTPDDLGLEELKARIDTLEVEEIIIALDATLEGDSTALYLKEMFQEKKIPVSRLAFGLPLGSSLDFVDGGTLARALLGRHSF